MRRRGRGIVFGLLFSAMVGSLLLITFASGLMLLGVVWAVAS